jgi:hypothetical protein
MAYGGPAPGAVQVQLIRTHLDSTPETLAIHDEIQEARAAGERLLVRWVTPAGAVGREQFMWPDEIFAHAVIVRSTVLGDVFIWLEDRFVDPDSDNEEEEDEEWENNASDSGCSVPSSMWMSSEGGTESDTLMSDISDHDSGYESGEDWGTQYDSSESEKEDEKD